MTNTCGRPNCENPKHVTKSGKMRNYCSPCESEASKRSRAKKLGKTVEVSETMTEIKPSLDEILTSVFEGMKMKLGSLRDRWTCEREYEDWQDYVKVLKEMTEVHKESGVEFVKASKRPFGIQFKVRGLTFIMASNNSQTYIKQVR